MNPALKTMRSGSAIQTLVHAALGCERGMLGPRGSSRPRGERGGTAPSRTGWRSICAAITMAMASGCVGPWAMGLDSTTGTVSVDGTDSAQLSQDMSSGTEQGPNDPALTAVCGNGILEMGEDCDDGNLELGDGCLDTCLAARCGDGIVWVGYEACDDGNLSNTDACLTTCEPATCGDGVVQAGVEGCDDGNNSDADACLSDCTPARCGDGVIWTGVEECDDGNTDNEDGCLNRCAVNRCGDGVAGGVGEQCDDGNAIDDDGCSNSCQSALCGDGVRSGQEECDDGNQNESDACLSTCRQARCGDGQLWEGQEACDPLHDAPLPACKGLVDSRIKLHDPHSTATCSNSCEIDIESCAYCGDAITQEAFNEVCDGAIRCDDPRIPDGFYDTKLHYAECSDDCGAIDPSHCGFCGDGEVQAFAFERCDDGNDDNTDACVGCELARCGDGHVWAEKEACDPGINANTPELSTCEKVCGNATEQIPGRKPPFRSCQAKGRNACQFNAWNCKGCRVPQG